MKNKFLIIFFLIFSFSSYGQLNTAEYYLKEGEKIIYFDSNWKITEDKSNAEFYRILKIDSDNNAIGEIKDYFKSGKIQNVIEGASEVDLNDNSKCVWEGLSIIYYESGEIKEEFNYVKGKIDGIAKVFYKSGEIEKVVKYVEGKKEGNSNWFYKSGKIWADEIYKDDKLENRVIYYENGEFLSKSSYSNGVQHGAYLYYFDNGKIKQVREYVNGEINGIIKNFNNSGGIDSSYEYINGKLTKGKSYYESGEIKSVTNYSDGAIDGKETVFFKSGKVAKENYFLNGEFESTIVFNKFGNEMYRYNNSKEVLYQPFKDKETVEEIEKANYAYCNIFDGEILNSNSINLKIAIEDGLGQYILYKYQKKKNDKGEVVFDGPYIEYYDFGQIKTKVNYINGKKHGVEEFYDRFGYITNRVEWNNGVKDNWSLECDNNNNCEYVFNSSFDDTDSTELQGWHLYNNAIGHVYVTSKPEDVKGKLHINNSGNLSRFNGITLPISQDEDFQISARADWHHGDEYRPFGLIVGFKDWDNYVRLSIAVNGAYKVDIKVKGIELGMEEHKVFKGSDLHKTSVLNIVRVGENLIFSINGKVVYTSKYSSLVGDKSGFFTTSKQIILFDDFKAVKSSSKSIPDNNSYSEWSGNGSGVILTKNGYIATNNHVIENANEIEVEFNYQNKIKSFKAEVIKTDAINDLAIIKINDTLFLNLTSIPYNFETKSSDVGQSVFALGYPKALSIMGKDIKFTDGKISSKSGYKGDITTYQTTTPIQPGNSGGPLFDYKGNLIAINSSKLTSDEIDNVSYSIKSLYLLTLIDALPEKVTLPSDTTISSMSLTNQIKVLSNYVVLIKVR